MFPLKQIDVINRDKKLIYPSLLLSLLVPVEVEEE
jgi:hypothetical protein